MVRIHFPPGKRIRTALVTDRLRSYASTRSLLSSSRFHRETYTFRERDRRDRRARLESCRCGIGGWLVCPPHIPPGGAVSGGRRADAVRQELAARSIVAWWTRRSPVAPTPS